MGWVHRTSPGRGTGLRVSGLWGAGGVRLASGSGAGRLGFGWGERAAIALFAAAGEGRALLALGFGLGAAFEADVVVEDHAQGAVGEEDVAVELAPGGGGAGVVLFEALEVGEGSGEEDGVFAGDGGNAAEGGPGGAGAGVGVCGLDLLGA